MSHGLISLGVCALLLLAGAPWPCLFWPAAFYLGREHAQAEQRYIDTHGGHRDWCPWWMGFSPSAWTAKGLFDWILPLCVAAVSWIAAACL